VYVLYITSLRTKVLKEELLTTETTNELRQTGVEKLGEAVADGSL
jgi:hypothetical protein